MQINPFMIYKSFYPRSLLVIFMTLTWRWDLSKYLVIVHFSYSIISRITFSLKKTGSIVCMQSIVFVLLYIFISDVHFFSTFCFLTELSFSFSLPSFWPISFKRDWIFCKFAESFFLLLQYKIHFILAYCVTSTSDWSCCSVVV